MLETLAIFHDHSLITIDGIFYCNSGVLADRLELSEARLLQIVAVLGRLLERVI